MSEPDPKSIFDPSYDEAEEARLDALAEAEIDAGQGIPHKLVREWMLSWGTPDDQALSDARAAYREAVRNSQLHDFVSMVWGIAPTEVTDALAAHKAHEHRHGFAVLCIAAVSLDCLRIAHLSTGVFLCVLCSRICSLFEAFLSFQISGLGCWQVRNSELAVRNPEAMGEKSGACGEKSGLRRCFG